MNTQKSILIIEDDHDARVALRQAFEELHYNVHSVANGADGLQVLRRVRPGLILLDLMMPLMNGEEFLRLKNQDPQLKDIPVIIMSAFEDRLRKITDFEKLKKPLDLDTLSTLASEIVSV